MSGQLIGQLIQWLILSMIGAFILYWVMHWLYRRSTKEAAFVRTGLFGEKVVIDGGAFVWPVVHTITPVNMNVLRLEAVQRHDGAAITKDRMRVDIGAEFYVRVAPKREAVSTAAATLGRRTSEPDKLLNLLEGKFVSALRSAASQMTLEEMLENRPHFVGLLHKEVAQALAMNGLELESIAVTGLDQSDLEYFNPSNQFDAEGLTALVRQIESRRKLRNDIEQEALVQIRSRNLDTEKQVLEIEKAGEEARLQQERDVEAHRARQRAELAQERAEREKEAEEAAIVSREAVEKARIESEREIRRQEIDRQKSLDSAEIEAQETTERLRIEKEQETTKDRIAREKALEAARMEKAIALYKKSLEQSAAEVEAELAKARVAEAAEKVATAQETESAARRRSVDVTLAEKQFEEQRIAAEAGKIRAAVEAEAQRLMNEAENVLTDEARHSLFRRKLLEHVEGIVTASAKPLEKISDIKIMQLGGSGTQGLEWSGGAPDGGSGGNAGGPSPADEVMNSALRYRVQAPFIDSLLKEMGVDGSNIAGSDIFRSASDMTRATSELARAKAVKKQDGGKKKDSG